MAEAARLWGMTYRMAAGRIYKACHQGLIKAYQRPGHQRFYLASELEAVFGPPGENVSKPAWALWLELSDELAEAAA